MYSKIDDYVLQLIRESSPEKTAWNIERVRQGKPADWNYIDGCMMTALLSMTDITGDARYFGFAESFIDSFIGDDGSIRTFNPDKHSIDDINEGRVLFELYQKTGKEKYRLAADRLVQALLDQPRTEEGNFWHKAIYPNQVWLDGLYMGQVFYVLYEKYFGTQNYADTVRQFENVRDHMRDSNTGLYFHGYDQSRKAFWADPVTGRSRSFWLRAIGWFTISLIDILEQLPDSSGRDSLAAIYRDLMASLDRFADPETGMYWQVIDQPGREGNYLETSGSSMIAYAMLKGARLGILDKEYAAKGRKTFDGIVNRYLSFTGNTLNLGGICLVAGLGPENNPRRDGTYEYYISEPIVENDAKGVAPFLLCYTEIKRLPQAETV
ncbi:MAG: glycoside hydrolase family 88 protein [Clostridia bacterium]|nr:glycoside hydrolase family 88 protein [Clostridia bacterium]